MENFSTQWFTAFYVALGSLLVSYGIYLLARTSVIINYLKEVATQDHPPVIWRKVLRYLLLFSIPGVVLAFFPFSWIELLFSVWSLFIIIMVGQLLVLWKQTAKAIRSAGETLRKKVRYVALNMITIGVILFMLCFLLLQRTYSG
jgi:hypothetical protein